MNDNNQRSKQLKNHKIIKLIQYKKIGDVV